MKNEKEFVIWGVSYGLLGDLTMGLPSLTYFEKKYPGSYKYWVIERKCSFCAPLFFNHPLIDRIWITEPWNGLGERDIEMAKKCDLHTRIGKWVHDPNDWYNYRGQVEETARIAGIKDLTEVLTEEEMVPKLVKWFDVGPDNPNPNSYNKQNIQDLSMFKKSVSVWPFAQAGNNMKRSPSVKWWGKLLYGLFDMGYNVFHFGYKKDPNLIPEIHEKYIRFTDMSYFNQLKISLASQISIGTDSGNMWAVGAYGHPAIHLVTNWIPGHNKNLLSLAPVNYNAVNLFERGGVDNIKIEDVLKTVEEKV